MIEQLHILTNIHTTTTFPAWMDVSHRGSVQGDAKTVGGALNRIGRSGSAAQARSTNSKSQEAGGGVGSASSVNSRQESKRSGRNHESLLKFGAKGLNTISAGASARSAVVAQARQPLLKENQIKPLSKLVASAIPSPSISSIKINFPFS